MSAKVLILGGGFGGWVAANKIRNGLPEDYKVTGVDRNDSSCLGLSLLWLITGDRNPDRISRPCSSLERKGISFVQGDIDRIDPQHRDAVVGSASPTESRRATTYSAMFRPTAPRKRCANRRSSEKADG